MNKIKSLFLIDSELSFFINLLKQADACETKFNHRRDIVDNFTWLKRTEKKEFLYTRILIKITVDYID